MTDGGASLKTALACAGGPDSRIHSGNVVHTRSDVLAIANDILSRIARHRLNLASRFCRLLVPSDEPAVLLAALIAGQAARATVIPYSERSGKSFDDLLDLFEADAVLRTRDRGRCEIEPTGAAPRDEALPADVLLTTSGSTGEKKGVCLRLEQLLLNSLAAAHAIGLRPGLHWICETDLALTSGLCHMLMAWICGVPFIHVHSAGEFEDAVRLAKDGYGFGGAPIHLSKLAERSGRIAPPRLVMSSGDFLTEPMVRKIEAAFPSAEIHKFYGLTEVAGRLCHLPPALLAERPDAAGFPILGVSVRVLREDGTETSVGERGEVCFRSAMAMHGYVRKAIGFEAFPSDSWFRTKDEGYLDSAGVLTLTGRLDHSFKVGGEKADSFTVERCLAPVLGGRFEYCVMPIPHAALGQCAALFVEGDAAASAGVWKQAQSAVASSLPSRYIPMYAYAVKRFPRLPNGKIDRGALVRNRDRSERLT